VHAQAAIDEVQAASAAGKSRVVGPDMPVRAARRVRQQVESSGKTQTDIMLGWLGMTRSDPIS
jgi:hypothetical protein